MKFRPRFSLRILFVLVTIFGCWLAYEVTWIRHRHQLLAATFSSIDHARQLAGLSPLTGRPLDPREVPTKGFLRSGTFVSDYSHYPRKKSESLVLRMLGEQSQKQVLIPYYVAPDPVDPTKDKIANSIISRMRAVWNRIPTRDADVKAAEELFPEADVLVLLLYVEPFAPGQEQKPLEFGPTPPPAQRPDPTGMSPELRRLFPQP